MPFVQSRDASLHCISTGEGPTLVLCHGLVFGSIASWYFSIAPDLAEHFRVVLYDQRGHGKSTITDTGYSIPSLAEDLDAVLDHYSPEAPVLLLGHSYGALVALHYALHRQHRVTALVLLDAPLPASHYVYPSIADIDSAERVDERLHPHMPSGSRAAARAHQRLTHLFARTTLRSDVAAANDIDDALLRTLKIPVLCVYGRESDCGDAGKRLARVLPNAQLHWLDCGHYIAQEMPEQLIGVLRTFTALWMDYAGEAK